MELRFCPQCGQPLGLKDLGDEGPVRYCEPCARMYLPFVYPSIIVAVLNEKRDIMLLRQDYVSKTGLVLVAGYIKPGETAEESVAREVQEETGLTVKATRYIASYPYENKNRHLMLGFAAFTSQEQFAPSVTEVDDIGWFPLDEVENRIKGDIALQLALQVREEVRRYNQVADYFCRQ